MRFSVRRARGWLGAITFMAAFGGAAPHQAMAYQISAPHGGVVWGLVVGIDEYTAKLPLNGAVADARDIYGSLKKAGVPDNRLRLILNQEAKRRRILDEMEKLAASAKSGDLVVLSFAGHGARIKEMYPNSKPDHMDEAYILVSFDETVAQGAGELIAGPEIKHWIAQLDAKGVDIVFVADTCHGGGLTRMPARQDPDLVYRQIAVSGYAKAEAHAYATPADAALSEASFSHLTFLAAVDPYHKTPEVTIPGQSTKRGALSYAMARAIEGMGGGNSSHSLTRAALYQYMRQEVSHYSDAQVIYTRPEQSEKLAEVVLTSAGDAVVKPVLIDTSLEADPVRVAVEGADINAIGKLEKRVYAFSLTNTAKNADLIWNAGTKTVFFQGDVIARDVVATDIPAVVDRVSAARLLARLADNRTQTFSLLPDNSLHKQGERLSLQAADVSGKYVIAFNITGDGVVQYLYPWPNDEAPAKQTNWTISDIKVTEPFGSDQVVVIVSPKRLTDLEKALSALNKTSNAGALPRIIAPYLDQERQVRIGLTTIVTAP